ncbi:MAG: ASCH domain-containing protein [Patescibacteria group bacterium]
MKKIKDLDNGKVLYKSHRAEPYFGFIKDGVKTVEGRLQKGLYKELKIGDEIQVCNNEETESVRVEILDLRKYSSFQEMLEKESFKKILPDIISVEEGVGIYRKFYTEEQEKEFGVVAIEVKLL